MKRLKRWAVVTTLALATVTVLAGCREEGPAERLGSALDEAASDLSDAVEDGLDEAQQVAEDTAEKIGDEADEAAKRAQAAIEESLNEQN